jgi:hypothetical protein
MASSLSPDEAVEHLKREFEGRITQTLKSLLETKHLYQSITIESMDLLNIYRKRVIEYTNWVEPSFKKSIQTNWFPISKPFSNPESERLFKIRFQTPDVKLFCKIRDRIEAFSSISSVDVLLPDSSENPPTLSGQIVQVFVLSFLGQSCKSVPEVFLVRRQGLKLTN